MIQPKSQKRSHGVTLSSRRSRPKIVAKAPTQARLLAIIRSLDWTGHFELGEPDMYWLAGAIATALSSDDLRLCQMCDTPREVVVMTAIGAICEECLDEAQAVARGTRELLEEEDD
jgi:hypothetical protein